MRLQPVSRIDGVAAPLLRDNIDTDLIIPSRAIRMQKEGLGRDLFAGWRYRGDSGQENPDFVLNRPAYRHASLLIAGSNFGCGSSREAAVWALKEFGIRAIVADSFGNIFYTNCIANGLVPVVLDQGAVRRLAREVERADGRRTVCVDLEACTVQGPGGAVTPFVLPSLYRRMLLEGLCMIDVVLEREPAVAAYERRNCLQRPWSLPVREPEPEMVGG